MLTACQRAKQSSFHIMDMSRILCVCLYTQVIGSNTSVNCIVCVCYKQQYELLADKHTGMGRPVLALLLSH